jgi:hypothetical protein
MFNSDGHSQSAFPLTLGNKTTNPENGTRFCGFEAPLDAKDRAINWPTWIT